MCRLLCFIARETHLLRSDLWFASIVPLVSGDRQLKKLLSIEIQ